MSKKPRNPKPGAGFVSKEDVLYSGDGQGYQVMRKGKTARKKAKRARQ